MMDDSPVEVAVRFVLFASCVVAIVVMVTSQQTALVPLPSVAGPAVVVPEHAKFKYTPAFIYFVAAFSVAGLYSILTALASMSVMPRPDLKLKLLLHFIFWDTVIVGIVASATGAAGFVAYVALKGNRHINWNQVCNVYAKFCRHVGASIAVAFFAALLALFLVRLSASSLRTRIPK